MVVSCVVDLITCLKTFMLDRLRQSWAVFIPPPPLGNCVDAGGRATHGAVAERALA